MTKCQQMLSGTLGQCIKQGEFRSLVGYALCSEHWENLVGTLTEYPVSMSVYMLGRKRSRKTPKSRFQKCLEDK